MISKNVSADQFCFSQLPKIDSFIELLKPFGITFFASTTFVGLDKYLTFCPFHPWMREKHGYAIDRDSYIQPQIDQIYKPHNTSQKFSIWQAFASNNPVVEGYREFNVNHGIALYREKEKNIFDSFHFASTNDNPQIINFYLNNLDFLNIFADYFIEKMSDVLDHRLPGRLIQLDKPAIIEKPHQAAIDPKASIIALFKDIRSKDKKNMLTPRQYECLQLLKKGYTAKHIAHILGRSPRTVEGYTAVLLHKLGLSSRYELIDQKIFNRTHSLPQKGA